MLSNTRILTGLASLAALAFVALFVAANPSTHGEAVRNAGVTRRAFMKVTPQGVIQSTDIATSNAASVAASAAQKRTLGPLGNTVWHYDDPTAIADGVSIDANNVWGAWLLSGARLTMHAITGVVQHYAWGDRRFIPELFGRRPDGEETPYVQQN